MEIGEVSDEFSIKTTQENLGSRVKNNGPALRYIVKE